MSGFSFPPPPPPPPKSAQSQQHPLGRGSGQSRGVSRGGHGPRGNSTSFSRGNHHPTGYQPDGFAQQRNWSNTSTRDQRQPQSGLQRQNLTPGAILNSNLAFGDLGHQNSHTWRENQVNESRLPPRTEAGHKRKLDALRGVPREKKPAPPTAPAVPSFGTAIFPLKSTPTAKPAQKQTSTPSKKSAASRSLGLTPAIEDPQYSSSESDNGEREIDEEAAAEELGNKLAFEHNGVLMSLNSQADLVAWKKERQKNWPTKQRMQEMYQERQRVGDERKRLLAHTQPLEPSARVWEWRAPESHEMDVGPGASVGSIESSSTQPILADVVSKSKLEKAKDEVAEKTKQLEELRRRVKESEARNRESRAQQSSAVQGAGEHDRETGRVDTAANLLPSETMDAEFLKDADDKDSVKGSLEGSDESSSVVSSDSPSEKDSDDEPPEQMPSTLPSAPEPVNSRTICKYFAASGHCRNGDACRFKHESLPGRSDGDRQARPRPQKPLHSVAGAPASRREDDVQRKGIFDRLLEQQQAEEDKLALKVIKYLGSVGFFKEENTIEGA